MPCNYFESEKDRERDENRCKHFWIKNSIAARVLLVISTYTTLIAIVDQASTKEALKDADNQTVFTINEEIRNATVSVISKSILWNCREYSVTRNYYKNIYIALITLLFIYIVIGMSKIPPYWEKKYIIPFVSDCLIRISLIFLLTSYDVSPWLCFSGPSSITYTKNTRDVDLEIPNSIMTYQKIAPFFSSAFGLIGWFVGAFVLEDDKGEDEDEGD